MISPRGKLAAKRKVEEALSRKRRHPEAISRAINERIKEQLDALDASPTFAWIVKLRVEFPGEGPRWLRRTSPTYEAATALRDRELASGKYDMAWIERDWSKTRPRKPRKPRKTPAVSTANDGGAVYDTLLFG